MPGHDHGPRIKDDELYDKLRGEGGSKEKAARITHGRAAGTQDHPEGQGPHVPDPGFLLSRERGVG